MVLVTNPITLQPPAQWQMGVATAMNGICCAFLSVMEEFFIEVPFEFSYVENH
jgi:hypothetical protein